MDLLRETVTGPGGAVLVVARAAGDGLEVEVSVVGGPSVGTFAATGESDLDAVLELVGEAVGAAPVAVLGAALPDLVLEHTAKEGTTLRGDTRPWAPAIKAMRGGWKWYGKGGFWYRAQSIGRAEPSVPLLTWATMLRTAGASVEVRQPEAVSRAEADAIRQAHLLHRAERYEQLAEKVTAQAASVAAPMQTPTHAVPEDVAEVLRRSEFDGQRLVLPGQLDRKLYERTNKVLEALGCKWNRGAKAHLCGTDAGQALTAVLESGRVTFAADLGYFPTPAGLAGDLVEMAGIQPGMRVLEPSAGEGAIVAALLSVGAQVAAVEFDPRRAATLHQQFPGVPVHVGDFLAVRPSTLGLFDAVVMNPPFSLPGHAEADVEHVEHALAFVKPGGRVVSVMGAGVTFHTTKRAEAFRARVERMGGHISELEEATFHGSGTDVRTVVIVIPVRQAVGETNEQTALLRRAEHLAHVARGRVAEARMLDPRNIARREAANTWAEDVSALISSRLKRDTGAVRVIKSAKSTGRHGWHIYVVVFPEGADEKWFHIHIASAGAKVGPYADVPQTVADPSVPPEEAYQRIVARLPRVTAEERTMEAADDPAVFAAALLDHMVKRIKRATGARRVEPHRPSRSRHNEAGHPGYVSLVYTNADVLLVVVQGRQVGARERGDAEYWNVQAWRPLWTFDAAGMTVEQAYQAILERLPKAGA